MTPNYIKNIRLLYALKPLNKPTADYMVTANDKVLYITDSSIEGCCIFVDTNSEDYKQHRILTISNPTTHPITLLQIDNRLLTESSSRKKCDCALIDHNIFTFVEFKTNAKGKTTETIRTTFNTAFEQLAQTITFFVHLFKKVSVDLQTERKVSATLCISQQFPRTTASIIEYRTRFKDRYAIDLNITDKIDV